MKITAISLCLCLFGLNGFAQTIQFGGITEVKALKRGKEYSVTWLGGEKDHPISIILLNREGENVQRWENLANDGEHSLKLGSRLKPGKGYTLHLMINKSDPQIAASSSLRIKRRVPLVVYLTPFVVIPVWNFLTMQAGDEPEALPEMPSTP